MTRNRESTLSLAGLMMALFMWPRLDTRAALRDLGGRMDGLEAGMKDLGDKVAALGERVARLEGKFELVEAYILRRDEPVEGATAE